MARPSVPDFWDPPVAVGNGGALEVALDGFVTTVADRFPPGEIYE